MIGIVDAYGGWCLDGVVMHFGTQLEAALEGVSDKNAKTAQKKRQRILEKWLDIPRKFRSPTAVTGQQLELVRSESGGESP